MGAKESKKISIIYVLKILIKYSDCEHYLTQQQILDYIYDEYNLMLERKSISNCIDLLIEAGYDIKKTQKGTALLSRQFEDSEIIYLVDAIFSSKSLSGKKALLLTEALFETVSIYNQRNFKNLHKTADIARTNNEDIFFNISIINEAIKERKAIKFHYITFDEYGKKIERKAGAFYYVTPYYLVNNFGRYYLICCSQNHNNLSNYRIDYMKDIEICKSDEANYKNIYDVDGLGKNFSITKYINEHIYLFSGGIVRAELEIDNSDSLIYIKDWFGENAYIYKLNDKIHVNLTCNENALYYWILQYSEHVKVISPDTLIERVKAGAHRILDQYR